jgi:hypothetical protein
MIRKRGRWDAGGCGIYLVLFWILSWPWICTEGGEPGNLPGPELSASLDRDSGRVGAVVVLTLDYKLPEGAKLAGPPGLKGLEDITIVDRQIGPKQIRIKALVDKLGTWKTGPVSIYYLGKDGKRHALTTKPVSLTVLSNLGEKPEEARLKPIQGIIPVKSLWLKYLPWLAVFIAIMFIGGAIFFWHKRRRLKKRSIDLYVAPHLRARNAMDELEAQSLFEKGYVKEFYFRLSGILRHYLEELRGFPAAESTTEEIALRLCEEEDRRLLPLLRQADLVKFADTIPTQAKKEEEVETVLSYIRETGPSEPADGTMGGTPK